MAKEFSTKDNAEDLSTKAWLLRDTELFTGVTDLGLLDAKRDLMLVLAGCKPVCEVDSGHWIASADGRRTAPDDADAVARLLSSLGLAYSLNSDDYATTAVVAKSQELVSAFEKASDAISIGRLFGFPESALRAYDEEELLMPLGKQDAVIEQAGLPHYGFFRFSRRHWRQELDTFRDWHLILVMYGLALRPADLEQAA